MVGEDGDSYSGTCYFPKFSVSHLTFVRFHRFLCGIDGGSRADTVAKEMVVDVSNFLHYASGSAGPDWERLLDRDQLVGFVEKLKRASIGPEGQLDALCCAIKFIKAAIICDATDHSYVQYKQATRWR